MQLSIESNSLGGLLALHKEMEAKKPEQSIVDQAIAEAKTMGLTLGKRVFHKWIGRGTIVGFNTTNGGFYSGDRYPVYFMRDKDGLTFEHTVDEFMLGDLEEMTDPRPFWERD